MIYELHKYELTLITITAYLLSTHISSNSTAEICYGFLKQQAIFWFA